MLPIAWIPSGPELWIVVLVVILLFGVKKLPEIGKSMAEGIHEFKKASRKLKEEIDDDQSVKPEAKSE
jgi:sec-independent protein translocase protein TatA